MAAGQSDRDHEALLQEVAAVLAEIGTDSASGAQASVTGEGTAEQGQHQGDTEGEDGSACPDWMGRALKAEAQVSLLQDQASAVRDSFRQEKLHLEGQIESLRDQVEMRESDLDQAFATLQQADAELLRLASEAGERAGGAGGAADDEAIQQLEKDLEAARWKADNLERQLDSAHFELTRLRGEEMASPTAADSAAPSRSDLERMAHTLTLAELREHYVRLQLEVAGSRSTFAEKDAEIKDRTEALVKAKTELAQLRTEVGSVEAVIEENEQLRAMLLDTKAAAEEAARRRQSA
ncbi:unnamed protein product, partial [Symbiodinium sp. KB8]